MHKSLLFSLFAFALSACQTGNPPSVEVTMPPEHMKDVASAVGSSYRDKKSPFPPPGWRKLTPNEMAESFPGKSYGIDSSTIRGGDWVWEFHADGAFRHFNGGRQQTTDSWWLEGDNLVGPYGRYTPLINSSGTMLLVLEGRGLTYAMGEGSVIPSTVRNRFGTVQAPGAYDGVYHATGFVGAEDANKKCEVSSFARVTVQIHENQVYVTRNYGRHTRPIPIGDVSQSGKMAVKLPSDETSSPITLKLSGQDISYGQWLRPDCTLNVMLNRAESLLPYDVAFEEEIAKGMPAYLPPSEIDPGELYEALQGKVMMSTWAKANSRSPEVEYFAKDGSGFNSMDGKSYRFHWKVEDRRWTMTGVTTAMLYDDQEWGQIPHLHKGQTQIFTTSNIYDGVTYPTYRVGVILDCWPKDIAQSDAPSGVSVCSKAEELRHMGYYRDAKKRFPFVAEK